MCILILIAAVLLVSSPALSHSTPSSVPETKPGSKMLRNIGHSSMLADQVLIDVAKNAVLSLANSSGGTARTYHLSSISTIMSFWVR